MMMTIPDESEHDNVKTARDPSKEITQCIFIKENDETDPSLVFTGPPPLTSFPNSIVPIHSNENSIRAYSRRNRVYVLRDFLFRTFLSSASTNAYFPSATIKDVATRFHNRTPFTLLDVAGGRGDLSWILRNVDGIDSIIADPRIPDHRRLVKSVKFLLDHPEEAAFRSVEGLPTYQPLAKLLPRLIDNCGKSAASDGCSSRANQHSSVTLAFPRHLLLHVDDTLVATLRNVLSSCDRPESKDDLISWDDYWNVERCRIESNKSIYGGTAPKAGSRKADNTETNQIIDSRLALEAFQSINLIVGFHPDQATEAAIDLALWMQVPFAVVPCCVFPAEFPNRILDGKIVRSYNKFLDYLCRKHPRIRKKELPFIETDTAKNVVIYMTKEDFY